MFWEAMPAEEDFFSHKIIEIVQSLQYILYFVPEKPKIRNMNKCEQTNNIEKQTIRLDKIDF